MAFFTCAYRAIFIFLLALVGVFYPYNRGALFTALLVIYALTSGVAGYSATSFYCKLEGTNWVSVLFTCLIPNLKFSSMHDAITFKCTAVTGKKPAVNRVPFLWSSGHHILLPQLCCHCIQFNCSITIWHDYGNSTNMDTSDISIAGFGRNCREK